MDHVPTNTTVKVLFGHYTLVLFVSVHVYIFNDIFLREYCKKQRFLSDEDAAGDLCLESTTKVTT